VATRILDPSSYTQPDFLQKWQASIRSDVRVVAIVVLRRYRRRHNGVREVHRAL
jgi:hypothetical protein